MIYFYGYIFFDIIIWVQQWINKFLTWRVIIMCILICYTGIMKKTTTKQKQRGNTDNQIDYQTMNKWLEKMQFSTRKTYSSTDLPNTYKVRLKLRKLKKSEICILQCSRRQDESICKKKKIMLIEWKVNINAQKKPVI